MRAPSSGARRPFRLAWTDAVWAALAPILAIYLRDAGVLSFGAWGDGWTYVAVSFVAALFCFAYFRLGDALPAYLSRRDVSQTLKVGCFAVALATVVAFSTTRLDTVPRSVPIVHALLLVSGLLGTRAFGRFLTAGDVIQTFSPEQKRESILLVGANPVTAMFIGLLGACSGCGSRVVGVLDENPRLRGRSIAGAKIIGSPGDLERLVDEFRVHGVPIDRLVIGGGEDVLSPSALASLTDICLAKDIPLELVPSLAGLRVERREIARPSPWARVPERTQAVLAGHTWKRVLDLVIAVPVVIVAVPIMAIVSLLVLVESGAPVLFWQQRLGLNGRTFLVYKFRTLRAPFDRHGRPVPEGERLSAFGRALRTYHLDELPQLFNVLLGDMSIVGPRPLLPIDQPEDPSIRLSVRPGLTGWAQLQGGKNISIAEKADHDAWYVANRSIRLDLQIILQTARLLLRGGSHESWVGDAAFRSSQDETQAVL